MPDGGAAGYDDGLRGAAGYMMEFHKLATHVLYKVLNLPCHTAMATPLRELCTGRLPQVPVICRARIDPIACFGDLKDKSTSARAVFNLDQLYICPPNVPVFTTEEGLKSMSPGGGLNGNGKRGRNGGDDGLIPIFGTFFEEGQFSSVEDKLIFVGISYNAGSRRVFPVAA